jgi:outer membrane protein assembly factor BamB
MRNGQKTARLLAFIVFLCAATPALAVITRLTPLGDVLRDSTFIVTAKVESVDADKPGMVLVVDKELKGKSTLRRLPVALKGDADAKRKNHVPQILKRVAPNLPLVLFVLQRDKKYTAFAYTNGTWFQLIGEEADGAVRWRFTHGEPYLRKTFKGSTAELTQTIVDCLADKKKPPEPDTKEKPGFGPEIEKKSGSRAPSAGGSLFAVIPTVLVGGPLAILAMLFPAVFGGLMLVLRRWMAALSVLSINSTLYLVQDTCRRWLAGSWWGTPLALWLSMSIVTLLGLLWAWSRHVAAMGEPRPSGSGEQPLSYGGVSASFDTSITTDPAPASAPPRKATVGWSEVITLGILSVLCLAVALYSLPRSLAQMSLWSKTVLTFGIGFCMATLHTLYRRWKASTVKPGLPGEGVLLWTMLLAGVALSATLLQDSSAGGISADENEIGPDHAGYRVAWHFRPPLENCWIASSPAVEGDRVYVGVVLNSAFGGSGAIYCVDRKNGKEIWTFNDGGDMKDVFSSPCVAEGRVYVGEGFHQHADCKLYCLDAATGKKLWDFSTTSHTESTPCVARGKVYFGAGDDGLYCLNAATGKEIWHLTGLHVDANPLVIDNRLYGGSYVGDKYQDTELFCLDTDTGEKHWRLPVDLSVAGMPAVQGECLYAPIGNGNFLVSADQSEKPENPAGALLCVERATGKLVWRYDVPDGILAGVRTDEKHVWFVSRDRHCYCLDRRDRTLRWKVDLGSPVVASPALAGRGANRGLYVAASDGLLNRLDPETGKIAWTFEVAKDAKQPAMLFSSPRVEVREGRQAESRLIWFGCGLGERTHGILYCLEERAVEKQN